jgi:GAF domain-containing protein
VLHRDQLLVDGYRGVLAAVQQARSPVAIAETAAEYARQVLEADGASVTQVAEDHYSYLAVSGRAVPRRGGVVPLAGSFTGSVVATRQARIFGLEGANAATLERAATTGIASGMVAPVLVDSRVVGTIGVTSSAERAFDVVALDALVGFADLLATAWSLHELRAAADARGTREALVSFAAEVVEAAEGIERLSRRLVSEVECHTERALAEAITAAAEQLARSAAEVSAGRPPR